MGISGLLGIVSLLGFLLFLGGIVTVVASASQGRSARGGVLLAIIGLIVGLLFSIIGQGILIVPPTEVAVVVNTLNGDLDPNARRGGTHIIIPVVQQAFSYPTVQQTITMDGQATGNDEGAVNARTSDGQEVRLDISVLYSVDPANVNRLHLTWQQRYPQEFVVPTARGLVRDTVSQFEAAEIYAGGRESLSNDAAERLAIRMERDGLILGDLIVRNITFSEQYADAIERAQIASQEAERARLEIQQREAEAQQAIVEAEGQRDAAIAAAQGRAQATILQAEAEAQALQLVSEQIAANPSLIQYLYVQNLSDNVTLQLIPANSPFLFDLESLAQADPNFTAPAGAGGVVPQADQTQIAPEPTPQATPGN